MKYALSLLLGLVLSAAAWAQPPAATVYNFTGCTFRVNLTASDPACTPACNAGTICIYPGQTVTVPGCGFDFYNWSVATVIPTTDDCSVPCGNAFNVQVAPNGCAPALASNIHCHCGNYNAQWFSPFDLVLYP